MSKVDCYVLKKEKLLFIIVMVSFAYVISLGFLNRLFGDQILIIALLNLLFLVVLFMSIQLERITNLNKFNNTRGYGRFVIIFSLSCLVLLITYFIPVITAPLLGITILISLSFSPTIGMTCGIYFVMVQALILNYTTTTVIELLFFVVCGALLSLLLQKKHYILNVDIMIFMLSISAEILFQYFASFQGDLQMILSGMILGVVNIVLVTVCFPFITKSDELYYENTLDYLLDIHFPLIQDLRSCSEPLFIHGIQVSKAAGTCANKLHLNVKLAAAGGLYYRLGLFEEKKGNYPGEILGMKNQFPSDLLQLIGEYKGEKQPFSTPESALVDIIDSVFEVMKNLDNQGLDNNSSFNFNQEVVIYKVLNDKSSSGIYDQSGFTMNMYISVRDYLTSEVDFNECFNMGRN